MTGAIVHVSQDQAAAPDPARGGAGGRGPDLRPPRARATTRCRSVLEIFSGRKAADNVKQGAGRDGRGAGSRTASSTATARAWARSCRTALDQGIHPAVDHQRRAAGRHEGGGRAVRRRARCSCPSCCRSAETMKAAVAYLEPFMEKVEGQEKGTIVLATVKGDVHDIGKNLVDIILTNNGYRVVNLGIKLPLADMVAAVQTHRAHAIGMSGLLVKSTVVMRENLEEMSAQRAGGAGAAGRRRADPQLCRGRLRPRLCRRRASGRVAYARDAFDGLHLMDKVTGNGFDDYLAAMPEEAGGQVAQREPHARHRRPARLRAGGRRVRAGTAPPRSPPASRCPDPPFWGARVIESPRRRRSCPSSTSAASINSSGASGSRAARWRISWAGRSRNCARC